MCGFAGFVNYDANFLFDISNVTGCLWEMADALGAGVDFGIDVVEDNGAFIQNSNVPISSGDYYNRSGEQIIYLFRKGNMYWDKVKRHLSCGAFFLPEIKALYLFRNKNSDPIYYKLVDKGTLVFGTIPSVLALFKGDTPYSVLSPGNVIVYDSNGLKFIPMDLFPVVNFLG